VESEGGREYGGEAGGTGGVGGVGEGRGGGEWRELRKARGGG